MAAGGLLDGGDEVDEMIKIHNFARGARGLRVMWQCEEMGLPYRVEVVSYPPSEAYLALNPLGTVPFLEDEGGAAINESIAMMLYLAQKYGPTPLLPGKDDPALARVLQMTAFGEATIGAGLNTLLEAHFGAPEAEKRGFSVRSQEARVERAVRFVAELLGDGPYLAGDHLTLADISVSTALGIWRGALGHALPDRLASYRERLAERPAYRRARSLCDGQIGPPPP
ncbi:glutathione S-transferase family protein [Sorangium sp. So ce1097]|uniref:glutathione S-transferase family protein n=1 Tax=Sorangium sp. So ce1097 TaxID=3133330 RepID=UPI003F625285